MVLLVHLDASSAGPRVMLVQVVLQVRSGRRVMDFLVRRAIEEIEALLVRLVPKEKVFPAPWVLLVYLDSKENLDQKEQESLDQRVMLDSEGCLVYRDLQEKVFKDSRVIQVVQVLQDQQDLKDKEFKDQRVNRDPRAWRDRGGSLEKDFLELKVTEARRGREA